WTFCRLVRHVCLHPQSGSRQPRIHDLRHTFAVNTVVEWYRVRCGCGRLPAPVVDLSRPRCPGLDVLVLVRDPRAPGPGGRAPRSGPEVAPMSTLAPTLQAFFTQRLVGQRRASPHTVAAYRDTFRLLLGFGSAKLGRSPAQLGLEDLDAPF